MSLLGYMTASHTWLPCKRLGMHTLWPSAWTNLAFKDSMTHWSTMPRTCQYILMHIIDMFLCRLPKDMCTKMLKNGLTPEANTVEQFHIRRKSLGSDDEDHGALWPSLDNVHMYVALRHQTYRANMNWNSRKLEWPLWINRTSLTRAMDQSPMPS